jgi:hypothetical protein
MFSFLSAGRLLYQSFGDAVYAVQLCNTDYCNVPLDTSSARPRQPPTSSCRARSSSSGIAVFSAHSTARLAMLLLATAAAMQAA